jgi:hypothetical protein
MERDAKDSDFKTVQLLTHTLEIHNQRIPLQAPHFRRMALTITMIYEFLPQNVQLVNSVVINNAKKSARRTPP